MRAEYVIVLCAAYFLADHPCCLSLPPGSDGGCAVKPSFPGHKASGRAQQFWRMYGPSILAVGPFRPELSVLLMVLATVKLSM